MALETKDSNFEELSQNNELLVVDFWLHGVALVSKLLLM